MTGYPNPLTKPQKFGIIYVGGQGRGSRSWLKSHSSLVKISQATHKVKGATIM